MRKKINDGIIKGFIKGKIENLETGEKTCVSHYLYYTGFKIETIIQIQRIEYFTHPDNTWQIDVECLGLDCGGHIFELCLNFTTEHNNEAIKIINDFNISKLLYIQGPYSINYENNITYIYDPIYSPLPDAFSESELNKVFMVNSGKICEITETND